MSNKTKKLTFGAMLCAIAYVVMMLIHVKLVPAAPFLTYDPKDVIIALGGLIWGPGMAAIVTAVVALVEMVTVSDTGIIGCIMNFVSTFAFAGTAAVIYKKKHTLSGAVIGLVAGCLVMTSVMLLWNYLLTPIYMGTPREQVAGMLIPIFLPFNLLKAVLNASFTYLLYKPLVTALRKAGLIEASTAAKASKTSWVMMLVAVLAIVACVLIVLYMKGTIG
ncbi:MAG: ECF transporter S component [Lachnospiraceae bacterium]|nr:ECF transporter S component [Lachnospiraceae bacterium]